jgi:hypothetical protein
MIQLAFVAISIVLIGLQCDRLTASERVRVMLTQLRRKPLAERR